MSILISNNVLQQTKLTETGLRLEIALMLFQQKRFTLGQAAAFTNLTQLQFQKILGQRKIPIHYGIEELEEDLLTLKNLNL